MIRFYSPEIGETGMLGESDSGHAVRVLRLREGDSLQAVDGRGRVYDCIITEAHPKHVAVSVEAVREEPPHWSGRITLAVAPTKSSDRTEWMLEKAVEIGVDEIVLLQTEHSERKKANRERLERVMVAAMKQSLKATLPTITEMTPLRRFLEQPRQGMKFVGYCGADFERRDLGQELFRHLQPGEDVTVMIGPEGDFSPAEIKDIAEAGFLPVTFGKSRLRTETAAVFALAAVMVIKDIKEND